MEDERSEACGRCSMTSVVNITADGKTAEELAARDPLGGPRIEIPEDELRRVSRPQVALGRLKDRLNALATEFVYGVK